MVATICARRRDCSSSLVWLTGGKVTVKARVVAIIIGLIASLMLMGLVMNFVRARLGVAAAGVSFGVSAALHVLVFALLMSALPRRTPDPGALLPGAAFASLVVHAMEAASVFFLPGRFSGASELYGGIGVAVVALGWLFVIGRGMAFSLAVNAALFDRFGSVSQGLFALPVLDRLPRRSEFIRRHFGLDAGGRSVESSELGAGTIDEQLLTGIEALAEVDGAKHPGPGRPRRGGGGGGVGGRGGGRGGRGGGGGGGAGSGAGGGGGEGGGGGGGEEGGGAGGAGPGRQRSARRRAAACAGCAAERTPTGRCPDRLRIRSEEGPGPRPLTSSSTPPVDVLEI